MGIREAVEKSGFTIRVAEKEGDVKLICTFDPGLYSKLAIPKALLVLKPEAKYFKTLGTQLKKLKEWQSVKSLEKGEKVFREIEVDIVIHYKKRTIDQNALLWSLYTIEADEMNGGMKGEPDHMIKPEELYEQDSLEHNPHAWFEGDEFLEIRLRDQYYILEKSILPTGGIRIHGQVRTSNFTTVEFSQRIEMVFNRMAQNGIPITNSGDILKYLNDHRQKMNDEHIVLYSDEIMTQAEYKDKHPLCEGCGTFVGDSSGQLAHIKAVGMGSDRTKELKKNFSSNWLHLCSACHNGVWHGKGEESFVKMFPHCKYKVSEATKRDYDWSKVGMVDLEAATNAPESTQAPVTEKSPVEEKKIDPDAIVEGSIPDDLYDIF